MTKVEAMVFTEAQRRSLEYAGTIAMTIDGIDCIVLRADLYGQLRPPEPNDVGHDELRVMLARSAEDSDWLDESMDIYDEYDKHR